MKGALVQNGEGQGEVCVCGKLHIKLVGVCLLTGWGDD